MFIFLALHRGLKCDDNQNTSELLEKKYSVPTSGKSLIKIKFRILLLSVDAILFS